MTRWTLHLESEGPVSPARGRERGFLVPAQRHLPGGALRGALAAAWIRLYGPPEGDPDRFAHDIGRLCVGPGLPAAGVQVPLSVLVCKYQTTTACSGVSHDLVDGEEAEACVACGGPLEPSKGDWSGVVVETVTRTALGLDERPLEGALFRREALAAGQAFSAVAYGELDWVPSQGLRLRVGGRRTVGGQTRVRVQRDAAARPDVAGSVLVVRLTSPAVFLGPGGRGRLTPGRDDLVRAVGSAAEPPVLANSWTRPELVGGWNAAAGLPKAAEVAAAAGSVFVLDYGRAVAAPDALRLEERGLGVRRTDGFGWLTTRRWLRQPPVPALVGRGALHGELGDIVADLVRLGPVLCRHTARWVREEVSLSDLDGRVSYRGLVPEARRAVAAALQLPDDRRSRLLVALEARS